MRKWINLLIVAAIILVVIVLYTQSKRSKKVREIVNIIINQSELKKVELTESEVKNKVKSLKSKDLKLFEQWLNAVADNNQFEIGKLQPKLRKSKIPMHFPSTDARWNGIVYA